MRKIELANEEYYHIYNRGIEKREVFLNTRDYERFLLSMNLLNDENDGLMVSWRDYKKSHLEAYLADFLKLGFRKRDPLVEIIAYCLNPNHYHLILKQVADKGIEKFMHKIGISHTKYFNKKNKRNGYLFQGVFQSVHIDSNEYLLYLSAYVNMNNFIHGYNNKSGWPHSSLADYLGQRKSEFINIDTVAKQFNNPKEYEKFAKNNALYMREKKELEKYLLEE
ncbi:MAG: transposase [Parcubacteria group bacterium]|jgi:putative transposase